MIDALAKSKKVRAKGRVAMKVKPVCASLRFRNEKKGGKPAAWNITRRRTEMVLRIDGEKGMRDSEKRMEAEKGKARSAAIEVKEW